MMQRLTINALLGAVILSLSTSFAVAQGHQAKVTLSCPEFETKGNDMIVNYGTYLVGSGLLRVNGDTATKVLFEGPIVPGANIPINLKDSGYTQSTSKC